VQDWLVGVAVGTMGFLLYRLYLELALNGWLPTMCDMCHGVTLLSKVEIVEHRISGKVKLCRKCYCEHYRY
jgi:hypothetical protein